MIGSRRPENSSGFFVDADSPQIHAAAAVAREIQVVAVGRPDGTPVESSVLGDRDWMRAVGGHGPDVALPAADGPVGDAVAVR